MSKKNKKNEAQIWVVVEEPFGLKGSNGQDVVLDEGTYFQVNSVSTHLQGEMLVLEPTNTKKKGFRFAVPPRHVRVYMGHLPDYRLDMYFVQFGYQADHFINPEQEEGFLKPTLTTCRDFGGSYKVAKLVERFQKKMEQSVLVERAQKRTERAILEFKQKL